MAGHPDSLRCPLCNKLIERVKYTRHRDGKIVRGRCCAYCGYRFQTVEIPKTEYEITRNPETDYTDVTAPENM